MKILFLTRLFYPHIGGVEKHVMEVSKRLVKRGHEVKVICEASPTDKKNLNIKIYRIPATANQRFKKFQIWWWMWNNRKLIEEADIVHAHDVAFWYFPFRFLYPRKPFFVTFHGYEQYPQTKKAILVRKISEKLSLGNICVGDYIPKWYGTKADYVTYGAAKFKTQNSKLKTTTLNSKLITFIGRLDEQTGIMTYLETLKILKEKGIELKITICGDGPLRAKSERFIQKNKLEARILGFIPDPEKHLVQARFAFVSRYLSILEAMAAKRLTFAVYDNPLKEDYLKMAPFAKWIVIESNPQELAERISHFLQNPQEEERSIEKAYNWAKEQSWDKMTGLYLKLWGFR